MIHLELERRKRHGIYKYLFNSSWISTSQQQSPKSNCINSDDLKQQLYIIKQRQQRGRSSKRKREKGYESSY